VGAIKLSGIVKAKINMIIWLGALLLVACSTATDPGGLIPPAAAPTHLAGSLQDDLTLTVPLVEESPTAESLPDPIVETETVSGSPSADSPPTIAPTDAGKEPNRRVDVPDDIRVPQLIPFDGIQPVYEPEFISAGEAPLQEDELIIGISLGEEAKAYPITVLRSREMVNDEMAGIPTLVTW
jgi:hypothetical protein